MYYIINITKNEKDEHINTAKVHMFPIMCRVDDIISGHLTLDSPCIEHCSDKYDILFGTHNGQTNDIIEKCIYNICDAHPTIPVVGVFDNGKYSKVWTIMANRIAENLHKPFEPLLHECKF